MLLWVVLNCTATGDASTVTDSPTDPTSSAAFTVTSPPSRRTTIGPSAVAFFTDGNLDMDDSQKADLLSFIRERRIGFVVVDRTRTSPTFEALVVKAFRLRHIETNDSFVLYSTE